MRPIYAGFAINVVLVILKYLASVASESASVNASLRHSLADLTFSGLILVGVLVLRLRPSPRFPFGYGRVLYVTGFAAVMVAVLYLLAGAVEEGMRRLSEPVMETSGLSIALVAVSLALNSLVLLDALLRSRGTHHPALLATAAENGADVVGDSAALLALALGNPLVDGYGAFVVAAVIAVSSASLGYRYVVSLVGVSAPRDVVGRVVKVALSDPRVVDVNEVKSLLLEPGKYLVFLQVEVDPETRLRELEEIRHYIESSVRSSTDAVERIVVEFVSPREPRRSFTRLLKEVMRLPRL